MTFRTHKPSWTLLMLLCMAGLSTQDCGLTFPWVETAIKEFAEKAFSSARRSTQTTEQALEAIKGVLWGKYPPGMEEVTLKEDGSGGVTMVVKQVSKPNQPYKPVGMLKVLRRAVETHQKELAQLLNGKPELKFIIETEDFPMVWTTNNWKLPAFSMCADPANIDIPAPDFTFEDYPETRYSNSSFWAIRDLILAKSSMVPWSARRRKVFMRHFGGVGYRKTLLPVLTRHQDNGTDNHHLGVRADVRDTGFVASDEDHFIWLDNWCAYRYLIHTAGFAYSAGLKYKLACGSVVFSFESKYREFYYPALEPGVHYESLSEGDEDQLHNRIFPQVKATIGKMEAEYHDAPPPMANAARTFIMRQLTPAALSCYWLKAITVYSKLYYAASADLIPEHITFEP